MRAYLERECVTDFLGKQNRDGIRNKCAADDALCFVVVVFLGVKPTPGERN